MDVSDQIQLAGVIAATVLGVISLIVALRANRTSAAAERLARDAYHAERRIAITSEKTADEAYLTLAPAGSDQTVNSVNLFFPTGVRRRPIAMAAGDLRLNVAALEHDLRVYWDARTPAKEGHAVVRQHVPVPVGVLVHGMAKGDAVITQGIYDLYCQYIRFHDKPSSVKLLGLSLNNWTAADTDLQNEVDRLLAELESLGTAL